MAIMIAMLQPPKGRTYAGTHHETKPPALSDGPLFDPFWLLAGPVLAPTRLRASRPLQASHRLLPKNRETTQVTGAQAHCNG